jgi:hypothetical protein
MPKLTIAYVLLGISALSYAYFWVWAMIHAWSTPKASLPQRALWVGAMLTNPSAAVWYWYVWKRWAFWLLFTPILGFFVSFPYIVKSALSKAEATTYTNILFALGPARLSILFACLIVFPLIIRLAALLHLGRNNDLSAMDRNDWVVSFAFPLFGFGASFAYCAQYKKGWAFAGLLWWVAIAIASNAMFGTISQELVKAGEGKRVETIQSR